MIMKLLENYMFRCPQMHNVNQTQTNLHYF